MDKALKPALADAAARRRVLTDHGATLLVEAGAGTGKTALIAGRVVLLLAAGAAPKKIAAITFTELATGELMQRIIQLMDALLEGPVPIELEVALPNGLSDLQRRALENAKLHIDALTCTTIHGFCYGLIKPFPVEADVDPGAVLIDEPRSRLTYRMLWNRWLRQRLTHGTSDDPLAQLVRIDPDEGLRLVERLAEFFFEHRNVRAPGIEADLEARVADFRGAVQSFEDSRSEAGARGLSEASTEGLAGGFELLRRHFDSHLETKPSFLSLYKLSTPPPISAMRKGSHHLRKYRVKGKWQHAAVIAGMSKTEGARWFYSVKEMYERVAEALEVLVSAARLALMQHFLLTFEDLKLDYESHKRSAALLDFDDLLYKARDLVRDNEGVRKALSSRYAHIAVDEFQDTDPIQAEILFRLCGEGAAGQPWHQRRLRPGQLFVVGDPKQAIYRFRRADIATYMQVRGSIEQQFPGNTLEIFSNFRSAKPILDHVNRCFVEPLSSDRGQPGFRDLVATVIEPCDSEPSVAVLPVPPENDSAEVNDLRLWEARAVANVCARLIGNLGVRGNSGVSRCRPGDIALLAPTGTMLWVYESELENKGIPVTTQAGKGLYRRQETQDFLILVRAIADERDTLAFGALMRGPMVGLTEQELLDIVAALPQQEGSEKLPRFRLWTDPVHVEHSIARQTLETLQELARRAATDDPYDVLTAAVERLRVRPLLAQRHARIAERALANVDLMLEMTRSYGVAGLRTFASDLTKAWQQRQREVEGLPDVQDEAVQLITVHSAKGLEWPVVIPINTMMAPWGQEGIAQRRSDETVHAKILDVRPQSYREVAREEAVESQRERVRLWYVACTRAKDLLLLPAHRDTPKKAWSKEIDLMLSELPELDVSSLQPGKTPQGPLAANEQTRDQFARESETIEKLGIATEWKQPSRHELSRVDELDQSPSSNSLEAFSERPEDLIVQESPPSPRGSRLRGIVVHKLMEEVLSGEVSEEPLILENRAAELIGQIGGMIQDEEAPEATEVASVVQKTLVLPFVRQYRTQIVPEFAIFASKEGVDGRETAIAGFADAVVMSETGRVQIVIDWKSDVVIHDTARRHYQAQVREYCSALDCSRAAIVYVTPGLVEEVSI